MGWILIIKYRKLLLLGRLGLGQIYDSGTRMSLIENPCEDKKYLELDRQFSEDGYKFYSEF